MPGRQSKRWPCPTVRPAASFRAGYPFETAGVVKHIRAEQVRTDAFEKGGSEGRREAAGKFNTVRLPQVDSAVRGFPICPPNQSGAVEPVERELLGLQAIQG